MHRPTRLLTNLKKKLATKEARSRRVGKKARRYKKQAAEYAPLSKAE